jgi:hypothetical protein
MKKSELKTLAEYFGSQLPAGRIKDRETRLAIIRLYASLASAYKGVADEIEAARVALVGDHQEEIAKFGGLMMRACDRRLTEEERAEAKAAADAMMECVRIDADFREAAGRILQEEIDVAFEKVPLEVVFEALCDCGLIKDWPIAQVATEFAAVIKEE